MPILVKYFNSLKFLQTASPNNFAQFLAKITSTAKKSEVRKKVTTLTKKVITCVKFYFISGCQQDPGVNSVHSPTLQS